MSIRPINRSNRSICYTLPAPLKGLNVRDSLVDMEAGFAITMDNYIPSDTKVALRPGYTKYASTTDAVETLAAYQRENLLRFIALAGTKAYKITGRDQKTEFAGVSFASAYCQTAQYKNYLYFVNGQDTPKVFYIDDEGVEHFTSWGFSGTGLTAASIINVGVSKQRLWFVEKNSLRVWYPEAAGNISGTLKCFDFAQVCRFGGHLVAVANWTQDGGQGIDDLTVFITSEGEALVYAGSNIDDASDWKLRGSYKISPPLGYQCLMPYQGDVVILTTTGYLPLGKVLPLNQASDAAFAFSDAIRGLVLERSAENIRKKGWQALIYPRGGYAVFNVPCANQFEQHVVNLNTGAWCRWTNILALCWKMFDGRLYFGSHNGIYIFDDGYSDNGMAISGVIEQAYTDLGTNRLKKIQLLNPRTKANTRYNLVIYPNMDMNNQYVDYSESIGNAAISKWDEAKWSSTANPIGTKWSAAGGKLIQSQWIAVSATGYKVSLVFKTKTKGNRLEWFETSIRYELGDGVF